MKFIQTGTLSPDRPQSALAIIKLSKKSELISLDEEQKLFIKYNKSGDKRSFDRILNSHLRLVYKVASKFSSSKHDFDDLISHGITGLIKAINKFNYKNTENARFSTYCLKWIEGEIYNFLLNFEYQAPINKSPEVKKIYYVLKKRISKSSRNLSYEQLEEIAIDLSMNVKKIEEIYSKILMGEISRDKAFEDNNEDLENFIDSFNCYNPYEKIQINNEQNFNLQRIFKAAKNLKKRERQIISQRFFKGRLLKDIAENLGISIEGVRQGEERALKKIKSSLLEATVV